MVDGGTKKEMLCMRGICRLLYHRRRRRRRMNVRTNEGPNIITNGTVRLHITLLHAVSSRRGKLSGRRTLSEGLTTNSLSLSRIGSRAIFGVLCLLLCTRLYVTSL